jgi:hypothetical protein
VYKIDAKRQFIILKVFLSLLLLFITSSIYFCNILSIGRERKKILYKNVFLQVKLLFSTKIAILYEEWLFYMNNGYLGLKITV